MLAGPRTQKIMSAQGDDDYCDEEEDDDERVDNDNDDEKRMRVNFMLVQSDDK